ncbi:CD3324 family protein [Chengkuizengella marina]|uniref:Mor transcription activator family protein n=1 Tax=Chengkuizengella marina TaxID=2507566 RepID=A0A6N9Q7N5_9BACL|nr:CD3324 family protein [Chengkuizengella marina]NBI30868.1 hypothetical protein [Chengkuizengella marina]
MKSVKANKVIPEKLLIELQKYVQGQTLYIPKAKKNYQKWGTLSGGRKAIDERNAILKNQFKKGRSINQLADEYYLSTETIKKIVYSKN